MAMVITWLFSAQCTFDDEQADIVLTEAIVYVSSETARFSGRVVESSGQIEDHGFQVSVTEDFSSPQTVSLSEKGSPGLFVGETSGLSSSTNYFVRAFMTSSGGIHYGETWTFTTLVPDAMSFTPAIANVGNSIIISGLNVTSDVQVFFGDIEGEVREIQFETNITVRVPPFASAEAKVPLTVVMDGETFDLGIFEYTLGQWEVENFDFLEDLELNLYQAAFAQTNSSFVVGLGLDNFLNLNPRVFEFSFDTWSWGEATYFGQFTRAPFVVGSYFGTGLQMKGGLASAPVFSNEFWQFTPEGLNRIGTVPFGIYKSIAAEINNEIYVYGGLLDDEDAINDRKYKYDGVAWSADGPHSRLFYSHEGEVLPLSSDVPNFVINNEAYFIMDGFVWKFDVELGTAEIYDEAPFFNCINSASAVLNGKFYVGLCGGDTNDFYQYDPAIMEWREKTRLFQANRGYNIGSFVHDEILYFLINPSLDLPAESTIPMRLYSLRPDEL